MYAQKKNLKQAEVNGFIVFQAINNQDADALACLDCYTNEIAVQIFNLQTILDPERFAIGGGISTEPVFIEYIKKNLDALYSVCPYNIPHAEVVSCTFQHDANLIGALQCYLANC
jgi:predicted NBD/HSP70 family sugar kinase